MAPSDIQYSGIVTKRDGTATRPKIAEWVGPINWGSQQTRVDDLPTVEGFALIDINKYALQASEERVHALDVTCSTGVAIKDTELTGIPNALAGQGYGLSMNYVNGAVINQCSAMNCRNGFVIASSNCVEIYDCAAAQCDQAGISVRNGSQNVLIRDCEQMCDIVIGNTQWPDAPRYVDIKRCCTTKIELQGACRDIEITNCEIRGPLMLCQIINDDGSIDAPRAVVFGGSRHNILFYTLNRWGEIVKSQKWAGLVSVDWVITNPVEAV